MNKILCLCIAACCLLSCESTHTPAMGWVSLFNGKSLRGWKAGDNAATFSVDSGMIIAHGKTAHLFYVGNIMDHDFKNFEFKAEVMTHQNSNSGIYIHTAYQESGWPDKGYEIQVNNSHSDWRRTGSLYGIDNIKEVFVGDNKWFTMYITVKGKRITVKLDDKLVLDYTEPTPANRKKGEEMRILSSGTFALQGHDPNSLTYFRNIMVKPLQ